MDPTLAVIHKTEIVPPEAAPKPTAPYPSIRTKHSTAFPTDMYFRKYPGKVRELTDKLSAMKETKIDPKYSDIYTYAYREANPYRIGRSIFSMSEYSVVLANIDAIFNVTGTSSSVSSANPYPKPDIGQPGVNFRYSTLADGPGGFTKYVQYRIPKSYGYGMSKWYANDERKLNWQRSELDPNRFEFITGGADTKGIGDLTNEYMALLQHAKGTGEPLNAVYANGGVGSNEISAIKLLLIEMYITIVLLKAGGDAVIRIGDTMTTAMVEAIYLFTYSFENVFVFKPCSTNLATMERYLICKKYIPDVKSVAAFESIIESMSVAPFSGILKKRPSDEFILYLARVTNYHLEGVIEYTQRYMDYAQRIIRGNVEIERYPDPDRFLILWALPSNLTLSTVSEPPAAKRSKKVALEESPSVAKLVMGVYNYEMKHIISRITDRTEKGKAKRHAQSLALQVAMGRTKPQHVEPLTDKWTHSRNGDYYTFVCGEYKVQHLATIIDGLLKKVSEKWSEIYQLVERYYPFPGFTLAPSEYKDPSVIDSFGSPLTPTVGKYCSWYDEDKVFGSMGKVLNVMPRVGKPKNETWVFYNHMNTTGVLVLMTEALRNARANVIVYTPVWDSNPAVATMQSIVKATKENVNILHHPTGKQSTAELLVFRK